MATTENDVSWLIEANRSRLHAYIRGHVGDSGLADDLAQETWIEVWRRRDTFDADRAGFWRFTRIWADYVLRRHRATSRVERCGACPQARGRECALPGDATRCANSRRPPVDWTAVPAMLATVDRAMATRRAWHELLYRVGRCPRPPHEVIVFAFSKLGWKPREVVRELADTALEVLALRLARECALAGLPVGAPFVSLRRKLEGPLVESLSDPRTRRLYRDLLAHRAGATTLRHYFPVASEQSAEAAVVHWWHAVQRSLVAETLRAGHGDLFEWIRGQAA